MRIGYENGIIEEQLVASASLNLNYPISNVLDLHMTEKYKSLGSGSLLITMRDNSNLLIKENTWGTTTKIVASDAQADDDFGRSVSISGDYTIIGAYKEDAEASNAGAAYIFHRTGTNTWDSGTKIVAGDAQADDRFGISVSISGDYVIVGADKEDTGGSDSGAAYIFHRTGTNTWDTGTKIVAGDAQADDVFGWSVSISGDYVVVGANEEDAGGSDSGAAYIFHRTGTNTWDSGTKIVAGDAQADDHFGWSVSISGDYAIVGSVLEDAEDSNAGAAYIFYRTGTNTWDSGTKIVAGDAQADDNFGWSVSISGDYAVVGAYNEDAEDSNAGAAYIFHRTGTNTWDTGTKIVASDAQANDTFGNAVSISGDYAIVGARLEDTGGSNAGAAYIFYRTGTNTWDSGTKIVVGDAQADDDFGRSVSISGDYVVVGADKEDAEASNAGAAYIFHRTGDSVKNINSSMCVINAHNINIDDTITLNGYTSAITGDVPSVSYNFTFQEYGMAVIFDEADLFWEIELAVTNPVEIGGIFLGTHLITPAYEIGAKTDHVMHDSYSMSGSGQLFGDEGYEGRKNNWLFPWITETEKPDWLTFFRAVGTIIPFYLLQYPDRQDIQPVIYCHRTNKTFKLEEHEGNRSLYKNIPLSTEEVF